MYRCLVSLIGKVPVYHVGGCGSFLNGLILRILKELRRRCCLCSNICSWFDFRIFSDKDKKPWVLRDIHVYVCVCLSCESSSSILDW